MYFINFLAEYYYKGNFDNACAQIKVSDIETIDFIRYMSKRQNKAENKKATRIYVLKKKGYHERYHNQ